MQYKILRLVEPDCLEEVRECGYHLERHTVFALDDPRDIWTWNNKFDSAGDASMFIHNNKDKFRGDNLIIVPFVSVSYAD